MKHLIGILIACLCATLSVAQQPTNKLIKELQGKHSSLKEQIAETESMLQTTKRDVSSQLKQLETLSGQIEERKRYIETISKDMRLLDKEISSLGNNLSALQKDLQNKKEEYAASVQYLYQNRSIQEKLMFIFSANNLSQIYRRMRYVREYATYQRIQGEAILEHRKQIARKKAELEQTRNTQASLLQQREQEQIKLEEQEKVKQKLLSNLKKKQKGLQNEIAQKRKEANRLNARIDKLIAIEIEKVRRHAEEEARRMASKEGAKTNKSSGSNKNKVAPLEGYRLNEADRALAGSFTANRGRLPIPITGPYMIVSHFGQYTVEGMKNVKLDNKGIDIQGKPGAQARAIFNGKVAAVFQLNGLFNILVRHGDYISVYCNLASTSVKSGDEVKTNQTLGQVFSDNSDNGRTILHFQLRKEREKLNPESWIGTF